jgi:signal transduction histidine kinase/DNA-binding response OmpR family regulator
VVDDNEASRYAVGRMLRQARFAVVEAATGGEALRLAGQGVDLVLLDVNLPDVSGIEVCQRLKAAPATATTPVLHLSANFVRSEHRSEGLEGGADGYLTYPLEPRELVATVRSLLRIRAAEQALRAQHTLLRVTLGSIADGVAAADAAGVVTFLNPVAQGLTGWGEEAVGRPLAEVFRALDEQAGASPPGSPAGWDVGGVVERVMRSGQPEGVRNGALLVARDGTRRPIDTSAAPIRDEDGRFVGVVLVFRDVSERRELEREVRRRACDLADRDRRKDEFLAMLAHELRNPLAPIRNTIELLKNRFGGDPAFDPGCAVLERQTAHLVRLIDDLMDVARITRGKFDLRKERVELCAAVRRAVDAVRPSLLERRHQLDLALPEGPVGLEADPARLEQILCNLLTNAIKYTPPGGRLGLSVCREGDEAVVRVRDNGIGIRADMLTQIFDLFQQADRVPGRLAEGLGIGLGLVRQLAQMHGGSVSAASPGPGQGSEFVLRLPAPGGAADGVPPPAAAPAGAPGVPHPPRAGKRVLVVDDNVDAAESLATLLRLMGHEVRTAYDGEQALAAAAAHRPEVVFLDVALPGGMDGYEVARRLRGQPETASAYVVAVTGFGASDDVTRARDAGMDHHLTKPADLTAIEQLLASRG